MIVRATLKIQEEVLGNDDSIDSIHVHYDENQTYRIL